MATKYITCVTQNDDDVITSVGVREHLGATSVATHTRQQIITMIEDGTATFFTAYKNSGGWVKGAEVQVIKVGGAKYIRTDANQTAKDNLDNLPEC